MCHPEVQTPSVIRHLFLIGVAILSNLNLTAQNDSVFQFPLHSNITATVFWVGESGNVASSWDQHWEKHFGGVDDPKIRNGYQPAKFTPKENPFYVALPFNDVGTFCNNGQDVKIGFTDSCTGGKGFFKNRWVKIKYGDSICFAQWEDVGPFITCDIPYVFGIARPQNSGNDSAGIDVSPAVRDYLKFEGNSRVMWQFVNENEVLPGPWKNIVTSSPARWD